MDALFEVFLLEVFLLEDALFEVFLLEDALLVDALVLVLLLPETLLRVIFLDIVYIINKYFILININ